MKKKKQLASDSRIDCSEETIKIVHKWTVHFKYVYRRDFTYEEVVLRALECLPLGELEVADSLRKWELESYHKRKNQNK